MKNLTICIFVVFISLVNIQKAKCNDYFLISENGLIGFIEIGMTLDDLLEKGIDVGTYDEEYFSHSGEKIYKLQSLSLEFELEKERIIRIWFFVRKKQSFKIELRNDERIEEIGNLSPFDIIRNFGTVKKYFGIKPPKDIKEAYWSKNTYFGIATNTINYPDMPFTFGLNDRDKLSFITVSQIK